MVMNYDLRPVVVRNNNGDRINIALTRAGIYKLVQFLAKSENASPVLVLNYIRRDYALKNLHGFGYSPLGAIATSLCRLPSFANWFESGTHTPSFSYENLVSFGDEYFFKEDTFVFYSRRYPRELHKYIRVCEECGDKYFDQHAITENGLTRYLQHISSNLLGYDEYCRDCCCDNNSDLFICSDCGRIFNRYDVGYEEIDGDLVCEDCLNTGDYRQCDNCGEWFRSDDGTYTEDHCFCSEDCCIDYGYHWSEYRDEWVYDDDDDDYDDEEYAIKRYHNHRYYPIGNMRKGQKHGLYIGRETEVDGYSRDRLSRDFMSALFYNDFKETCVFERDGSLDQGFEIISHPMTEKAFFNFDWNKGFDTLRDIGFRSHDTSTCGTHFHYSKWYLGYTYTEQLNSAKKLIAFIEKHWGDIVKISRRKDNDELSWCKKFGFVPNKNTDIHDLSWCHDERYYAINLEHLYDHKSDDDEKGTIEVRVCKGTLNVKTMLASADFFLHLVRNAKRISWENIDNLKLWFKGITNPDTIEYIKSRNAFEGAF